MNSILSLIIFLITTIVYFWMGKASLPLSDDDITKKDEIYAEYYKTNMYRTFFYFIAVLFGQIIVNIAFISQLCSNSFYENLGAGALLALIPWFFIFGIMIIVLMIFPALKNVFSNVIGYAIVYLESNNLLSKILNNDISSNLSSDLKPEEKSKLAKVGDFITKISGNKSLIINEFNVVNFNSIWETPFLFKEELKDGKNKELLYNIILRKDNIGEFCWYLYTAFIVTSIVTYNTVQKGCNKSLGSMQASSSEYDKQAADISAQQDIINSKVYTM